MKHLAIRILVTLILCLAPLAWAAPPADGFAATFVQTRTLPGFAQPIVSHGVMRFSRSAGFHWEITKPYHYVFEMHDDAAHEVLPDGRRRELKASDTPWLKAVQRIFVSALSGDRAQLARYFHVEVTELPDEAGRHVTLTPRSDAMAKVVERIEVTERAPGQPTHLVIDETSGGRMDVRFTPIPSGAGSS